MHHFHFFFELCNVTIFIIETKKDNVSDQILNVIYFDLKFNKKKSQRIILEISRIIIFFLF
jgi:hypothetical protein